ncbi:MAG: hypothetical protein H7A23_10435 [Leptospiraceae bacterium]|nr:hypothetical protein [Leptospiraceae bacterium]MCP5494961.1 hypothetical protein [Leptospiraceae bacterium]
MQDRPDAVNLLETIQDLLIKDIMPAVKENDFLSYRALVSWNMLGVVAREFKLGEKYLNLELERLSKYLGEEKPNISLTYLEKMKLGEQLNKNLVEKIRKEKSDDTNKEVWELVKQSLKEKLEITNPRFSLD